jgi:hypothetical protein
MFESCGPSQFSPVSTVQYAGVSKPRGTGGISWIPPGLRVGNLAPEPPFRPLVSEAAFWCLVLLNAPDRLFGVSFLLDAHLSARFAP